MRALILESSFDGELPLMKPITMLQKELENRDFITHYTLDRFLREYENKKFDGKIHTKKDGMYRVKITRFAFLSDGKPGLFYLDEDRLLILWGVFEKKKFENRILLAKIKDYKNNPLIVVENSDEMSFSENEASKARTVFKSFSKIKTYDALNKKF